MYATPEVGTAYNAGLFVDCLLLFYAIATVLQLYHGGDIMTEMRRVKARAYTFIKSGNL